MRLLHVVPEGSTRDQIRVAWGHLARKASGGPGPKPSYTVLVGDPARQIVECAVAGGAGLIVLRSRAAGGPPNWTRGRVAERVVQEAPVPVLLLSSSRHREAWRPRQILVPIQGPTRDTGQADGRRSTLAVLRLVAALARRQEAVVQLVAAVQPRRGGLLARRAKAEAYLEELHGSLSGVVVLRRVITGRPAEEAAKSLADEDLLAVSVPRDLPGPAGSLLRRCPCALLTVPVG